MNTTQPAPSKLLVYVASAFVLLAGIVLAAVYGWLLIFRPGTADEITAVLVLIVNGVVIFINPFAGFLLWLVTIPFAPFLPFDIHMPAGIPDLSYTRMVGVILVLYLLAQITRGKRRLSAITAVDLFIPFFGLALLVSALRSGNGWLWGIQSVFDSYLMPLLVYFIARQMVTSGRQFRQLSIALVSIGLIVALLVIIEQTTGVRLFQSSRTAAFYGGDIRKVGSLLGNPAYISLAIAVIIPLALAGAMTEKTRGGKLLFLGAFLFLETGILLTYNRSGWIGGILAFAVIALLNRRAARFAIPILISAGIVIALSWGSIENSAIGRRLTAESPIDYRVIALEYGLDISQEEPLLGIGWGSFGRVAAQRGFRIGSNVQVLPSTHDTYLNLLVSGGYLLLGGFLLLVLALVLTLLQAGRVFQKRGSPVPIFLLAAWASFFAYFIASVGFDNNFAIYANMVFWAIMGGAISAAQGEQSRLGEPQGSAVFATAEKSFSDM